MSPRFRLVFVIFAILLAAATAHAQLIGLVSCTASAVPPVVRAEGISEAVGDIILSCIADSGIVGPNLVITATLSLNVFITNNKGFEASSEITDAVMVVNENNCTDPQPSPVFGVCGSANPAVQDPQHGLLADVNRLEWTSFNFPVPGAALPGGGTHPLTTTLRFTSIRANASQLGIPDPGESPSAHVAAFISLTGSINIPVSNNVLNVATPIRGMIANVTEKSAGVRCFDGSARSVVEIEHSSAPHFRTQDRAEGGRVESEIDLLSPGEFVDEADTLSSRPRFHRRGLERKRRL